MPILCFSETVLELSTLSKHENENEFVARVLSNCFQTKLYGVGSLLNYSCFPNVAVNEETNEFIATRDIAENEELFIFNPLAPQKSYCKSSEKCPCHKGSNRKQPSSQQKIKRPAVFSRFFDLSFSSVH